MSAVAARARRLVIAAESLGGAEAALAFCRSILEWSPAKPTGRIIDSDSAGYWTGSGNRLVSTGGAVLPIPPPDRLRRMARGDAEALAARLAGLATELNTESTCELCEGELVSMACATIEHDDILILGQRPVVPRRGKVLLLEAGHGASVAARGLADALAWANATSVSLISPARDADQDALIAQVDRSHAGVVVADFEAGPLSGEDELRRLFAAARCPVTVLGGSRIRRPEVDVAS